MDLDAYTTAKRGDWDRLGELAKRTQLSGAEADELIGRYQAGATDLSALRTTYGETAEAD
ncbi:MAG: stage II sporulation protein M, partial [Pseudoclavibacter sp.]